MAGGADTRRILLVEDDDSVRGAVTEALRLEGYEVSAKMDAYEGLQALSDGYRPDLILCDYTLPGVNGIEFARRVRTTIGCEQTRMVLVTAAFVNDAELAPLSLSRFRKPFDLDVFLAMVKRNTTPAVEIPSLATH